MLLERLFENAGCIGGRSDVVASEFDAGSAVDDSSGVFFFLENENILSMPPFFGVA